MRPGITLLAVLKVHINSGKMDTPLTVSKSGRQHGRKGHIPLDPSTFKPVLLLCNMYTNSDLHDTCVKETITLNYSILYMWLPYMGCDFLGNYHVGCVFHAGEGGPTGPGLKNFTDLTVLYYCSGGITYDSKCSGPDITHNWTRKNS